MGVDQHQQTPVTARLNLPAGLKDLTSTSHSVVSPDASRGTRRSLRVSRPRASCRSITSISSNRLELSVLCVSDTAKAQRACHVFHIANWPGDAVMCEARIRLSRGYCVRLVYNIDITFCAALCLQQGNASFAHTYSRSSPVRARLLPKFFFFVCLSLSGSETCPDSTCVGSSARHRTSSTTSRLSSTGWTPNTKVILLGNSRSSHAPSLFR